MILKWFCFSLLFLTRAAQAFDFTLTEFGSFHITAPSMTNTSDPSLKSSPGVSIGIGGTLGVKLLKTLEAEVGLVYQPRTLYVSSANAPQASYSTTFIHTPLLIRYWIFENFSVAAGFYLSTATGQVTISESATEVTRGYSDIYWSRRDFGLATSIRFRTHLNELVALVIDQRLNFGLLNNYESGQGDFYNRDLQTWFGIAFEI